MVFGGGKSLSTTDYFCTQIISDPMNNGVRKGCGGLRIDQWDESRVGVGFCVPLSVVVSSSCGVILGNSGFA
jgi:hypothetical protein